jgi:hypothetical protein
LAASNWLMIFSAVTFFGKDIHRNVDQHRAGTATFGEDESFFQDLGEEVCRIDTPDALAERTVNFALGGIGVQVHFLVRVLAVVMRRHVAGDHDHRDRIERGVSDTRSGVGQARREVRQQH